MRKVLKWIGIVLGGLIGLVVLALVVIYFIVGARLNKTYDIPAEAVTVPTDAATVKRGEVLTNYAGCTDCHTANLAGDIWEDTAIFARFGPANLTSGAGGIGNTFGDADWVRAIRHGIGTDGKPLIVMPSHLYYYLSDADLGAIIAYVKSVSPVDKESSPNTLGPLGRVIALLEPNFIPAALIDHTGPRPVAPEPGVTVEYGQYLGRVCQECHGPNLAGEVGEAGAEEPAPANLTPGGDLATWSEADFIETIRTGRTPTGRQLNPQDMPWPGFSRLSDDELRALWLYLQSVPAQETGGT
jgi:mono/diheme cytochrome c family protein